MKFDIVTLFPEFFSSPLETSLLKKAVEKKLLEINPVNLRNYSRLPHKQVDDTPYGGGAGMVLRADILAEAVKDLKKPSSLVILPDPGGKVFDQELAGKLSQETHLIFVCGRYEGVDQRFKDNYVDLEVSLGDYILNGGEAASLVILESVARLIPGVIGNEQSLQSESFSDKPLGKLLEYPQYTRPEEFEGKKVPEVLLSGNHKKIEEWRQEVAMEKTKKIRPDLIKDLTGS